MVEGIGARGAPLDWKDLESDAVLRSFFTNTEGVVSDYPTRLRLANGTIFIDDQPLPKPRALDDRLTYQRIAVRVARWIHEGAMDAVASCPDQQAFSRLGEAHLQLGIAQDMLRAFAEGVIAEEISQREMAQADVAAHRREALL